MRNTIKNILNEQVKSNRFLDKIDTLWDELRSYETLNYFDRDYLLGDELYGDSEVEFEYWVDVDCLPSGECDEEDEGCTSVKYIRYTVELEIFNYGDSFFYIEHWVCGPHKGEFRTMSDGRDNGEFKILESITDYLNALPDIEMANEWLNGKIVN